VGLGRTWLAGQDWVNAKSFTYLLGVGLANSIGRAGDNCKLYKLAKSSTGYRWTSWGVGNVLIAHSEKI